MTHTRSKGERRRCCECRGWYVPEPSAATTQRTCSRSCRLVRRARQEKVRRAADLTAARADERDRQRLHRARKGDVARAGPPMSRAGLWWELTGIVEEILEEVGQAQRRSQAGLRRRVRRNVLKTLGEICRTGAELGHDRAMSLTGLDR